MVNNASKYSSDFGNIVRIFYKARKGCWKLSRVFATDYYTPKTSMEHLPFFSVPTFVHANTLPSEVPTDSLQSARTDRHMCVKFIGEDVCKTFTPPNNYTYILLFTSVSACKFGFHVHIYGGRIDDDDGEIWMYGRLRDFMQI